MLEDISQRLFADQPDNTLYHYTSLSDCLGIVDSGLLRASDIRYMNDSAELRHTLDLLRTHITQRVVSGTDHPVVLNQLLEWLSHRVTTGPMLFGASFRANGNLLSQWRGYSVHGKGVSLGFDALDIFHSAGRQRFQIARCLYSPAKQRELIESIVDTIERQASIEPEEGGNFYPQFELIEADLLRIAAVLKHPSFEEEQEWRIVSPVIRDAKPDAIQFREGRSMLVPYYNFTLGSEDDSGMRLEHVYLGPTPAIDLSMNSLRLYLSKRDVSPRRGIEYCQIPYRQRS